MLQLLGAAPAADEALDSVPATFTNDVDLVPILASMSSDVELQGDARVRASLGF